MKKTTKFVFETKLFPEIIDTEDGGRAKIVTIVEAPDNENGIFIRLQSWDEEAKHEDLASLVGKTIRITIETID